MYLDDLLNCNNTDIIYPTNFNGTPNMTDKMLYLPDSVYKKVKSNYYGFDMKSYTNNYGYYFNSNNNQLILIKDYYSSQGAISIGTQFFYRFNTIIIDMNNYNVIGSYTFTRPKNTQDKQYQYCPIGKISGFKVSDVVNIGNNYIDDLIYSGKSTDILIYSAYLIIPILIVLFLIKVFRKGIH